MTAPRMFRAAGASLAIYGFGIASSPMVAAVAVLFGFMIYTAADLV